MLQISFGCIFKSYFILKKLKTFVQSAAWHRREELVACKHNRRRGAVIRWMKLCGETSAKEKKISVDFESRRTGWKSSVVGKKSEPAHSHGGWMGWELEWGRMELCKPLKLKGEVVHATILELPQCSSPLKMMSYQGR